MKIVVLVKHAPEPKAVWPFAADHTLDRDSVAGRLSDLPEHAVAASSSTGTTLPSEQ
jgi:hypothetical protein